MVAWVTEAADRFEQNLPLLFGGRRNQQLGQTEAIELVFIDGFERLPEAYLAQLRDSGYAPHNAAPILQRHAQRFTTLDRFGAYGKFCFLRWLVLAELYAGEPLLHVDGDVVFNESPTALAQQFKGFTLVLQGCPAVTAIADPSWFRQYETELIALARDVDSYTTQALRQRTGWEGSARTKWAGSWDRSYFGHDQDLISHLIHTDRIVQADPAIFMTSASGYVFFENPLLIGDLVADRPLIYERVAAIDYLNSRRIAFWHMQTDWCRYLVKHLVRKRLNALAGTGRVPFGEGDWEGLLARALRRLTPSRIFSRAAIYRQFFEKGDFSEVFTDRAWWQANVFSANPGKHR